MTSTNWTGIVCFPVTMRHWCHSFQINQ